MIPFSLLGPGVTEEEKIEIADRILDIYESKGSLLLSYEKVDGFIAKKGDIFVDQSSKLIFNILKMESQQVEWMKIP